MRCTKCVSDSCVFSGSGRERREKKKGQQTNTLDEKPSTARIDCLTAVIFVERKKEREREIEKKTKEKS